jgi:hypothetical protein
MNAMQNVLRSPQILHICKVSNFIVTARYGIISVLCAVRNFDSFFAYFFFLTEQSSVFDHRFACVFVCQCSPPPPFNVGTN